MSRLQLAAFEFLGGLLAVTWLALEHLDSLGLPKNVLIGPNNKHEYKSGSIVRSP